MKPRVAVIVGVGVLAAAGGFALSGAAEPTHRGPSSSPDASISAPPAPVEAEPVTHVVAEPAPGPVGGSAVALAQPAPVELGVPAVFEASWVTPSGQEVSGALDLQRIEGRNWTTVGTLTTEAGTGRTTLSVPSSGIYRLAYGGSATLAAAASTAVTVTAGPLIGSHLTATVTADGASLTLTAGWTTEGGVAISGPLTVEALQGAAWIPFTTVTTGEDGTAIARLDTAATTRYRVSYAGGSRFAAAVSDETVVLGDDVRTVPVSSCSTDGEIDRLDRGAGCHYTPVTAGTFVVAHDYLGNAWWNAMPMNSYVELSGELAGVYEVVDRVIAPGRGSALGSASNWTCGDDCDVILQTCQGENTGFTWLLRTGD